MIAAWTDSPLAPARALLVDSGSRAPTNRLMGDSAP
jgi:hypothetical protein